MSTLREPYRIEGKKTMGIELAEQLGWKLPTHIVYPTGGGTGLIGMWKVFREMIDGGWLPKNTALPKMIVAQAEGCAPIVRAFHEGKDHAVPWENPVTHAAGLRVPGPLGDRLILKALARERRNGARRQRAGDRRRDAADRTLDGDRRRAGGRRRARRHRAARREGHVPRDSEVLVFNTGSGASYRV